MPTTDFHSDLRHVECFLPRQMVSPRTYRFIRFQSGILQRCTPNDIEVVTLRPGVTIRLFRPAVAALPEPALLWIHGGGYVIGTAAQDDNICARFASELGTTVAAVDYRLAPEHPYPAALDDCYSALTWLAELPSVDPPRLAIGGVRAGGIPIQAQLLVYPMLDDRTAEQPEAEHPKSRLWSLSSNKFGWAAYLGDADPDVAVLARRKDLAGLAPAWIGVGDLDLFYDEDLAYAGRLQAANVPCELEVVAGRVPWFRRHLAEDPGRSVVLRQPMRDAAARVHAELDTAG